MSGITKLAGIFYDGKRPTPREVWVEFDSSSGLVLRPRTEDGEAGLTIRRETWQNIEVGEYLAHTAQKFYFRDGAVCEVADCPKSVLPVRVRNPFFYWFYAHRRSLLVTLVILLLGYFFVLPWAAKEIALRIPKEMVDNIGDKSFAAVQKICTTSALSKGRQEELRKQMLEFSVGTTLVRQVEFCHSPSFLGANAFDLPSGIVIFTDDMVNLVDDKILLGVLAHEMGHEEYRHGLQQIFRGAAISAIVTLWLGDFTGVVGSAAYFVLNANYSRDMERQADDYGAKLLIQKGYSPKLLVTALKALEDKRDKDRSSSFNKFLSSHPATEERINRLNQYK